MNQQANTFLLAILGPDGFQVLSKAATAYPELANALLPKAVLTFLETAQTSEYQGEIPGIQGQISLSKSESKLSVESGDYTLTSEPQDLIKMTAILLVNLGETSPVDSKVSQSDIGKLSKSLDLLVKHKTNAWLQSLQKTDAPGQFAAPRAPMQQNAPQPPQKGAVTGKAKKLKLPVIAGMVAASKTFNKSELSKVCKTCGSPQLHKRWGTFDGCVCTSKLLKADHQIQVSPDKQTYTLTGDSDLVSLVEELVNGQATVAESDDL